MSKTRTLPSSGGAYVTGDDGKLRREDAEGAPATVARPKPARQRAKPAPLETISKEV